RRALDLMVRHGTTGLRAQIDVDDVVGLRGFEAALALRQAWAAYLDVQVLAFPQEGLASNPAAADLVREALRQGADVIGGGAVFDGGDIEPHLEQVFGLAEAFGVDIDLHVDLATPPDWPLDQWELASVARRTRERGWQGRVTVAHLTQLGQLPVDRC